MGPVASNRGLETVVKISVSHGVCLRYISVLKENRRKSLCGWKGGDEFGPIKFKVLVGHQSVLLAG